jgi:hypothetical protein
VDILRAFGYPNRVVAILAPLLAPLVAWGATALAEKIPGLPKEALEEIFLAVVVAVIAPALQFIQNRAKWDMEQARTAGGRAISQIPPAGADAFQELGLEAEDGELPAPEGEEYFEPGAGEGAEADEEDWDEEEDWVDEEEEEDELATEPAASSTTVER